MTDDTMISVSLPLIPDADNGNSAIISYELLCDDGLGGDYVSVGGLDPISLVTEYSITQGIERGRTYRLIYRTLNDAGWSDYSPALYALSATAPSAPPAPTLVSATGTTIKLAFKESEDNGGSKILFYELHMDTGLLGSSFTKSITYGSSLLMEHELTFTDDAIASGTVYTFKYIAKNIRGYSAFSSEVRFAAATKPSMPATPTKVLPLSSKTSITVAWA